VQQPSNPKAQWQQLQLELEPSSLATFVSSHHLAE